MLPRTIYQEDHEIFRRSVQRFIDDEIQPYHAQWEKDGIVSREVWLKAGEAGLLLCDIAEEYGGSGGDFLFGAIVIEELAKAQATGPRFSVHSNIVAPYIARYGTHEQKSEWLPPMAQGRKIGAIAMTEPGVGSDLQNIATSAALDGNEYIINGQKTLISNAQVADIVIVAAKTVGGKDGGGISLVVVEADRDGFQIGCNLDKIGMKAQDTSELFFDNVRVPTSNRLGEEGRGFEYLKAELAQERLVLAIWSAANVEAAIEWTKAYTMERKAFGRPISSFQNTRFKLAEAVAQSAMLRVYVDRCIELHTDGALTATMAAAAKLVASELQGKIIDECLQLFGGYGYMWEYPIARAYADARVTRIFGGTSEIMKLIISREIFDR